MAARRTSATLVTTSHPKPTVRRSRSLESLFRRPDLGNEDASAATEAAFEAGLDTEDHTLVAPDSEGGAR